MVLLKSHVVAVGVQPVAQTRVGDCCYEFTFRDTLSRWTEGGGGGVGVACSADGCAAGKMSGRSVQEEGHAQLSPLRAAEARAEREDCGRLAPRPTSPARSSV